MNDTVLIEFRMISVDRKIIKLKRLNRGSGD